MSYAIGEIVYGTNLKSPWGEDIMTADQRMAIGAAIEQDLIHTAYSGSGEVPCWVGPLLSNIDECNDVEISTLVLTPTDEQRKQFAQEVDELLSQYPILGGLFDNPTVFITWGSS